MVWTLVASVCAAALMLATSETIARPSGARGGVAAPVRAMPHPFIAHSFRHHHRGFGATFWPGDFGYGATYGEAPPDVAQPTSNDTHYTYTYDVPWDWAHRLPPQVAPSDRPYVPSCSVEGVTVPGHDGGEQTVNVTRCY